MSSRCQHHMCVHLQAPLAELPNSWTELHSGASMDYAWDEPTLEHRLRVRVWWCMCLKMVCSAKLHTICAHPQIGTVETDYDIDMPNILKPLLVPVELKQVSGFDLQCCMYNHAIMLRSSPAGERRGGRATCPGASAKGAGHHG